MGTKLLLVEDNDLNRDMLVRRLSKRGYDIVEAIDGEQAIDAFLQYAPDAVIMDMALPVRDGWSCTHVLKKEFKTRAPIIALTAHAMAGDRNKAIEAGCDAYLTKPVNFAELIATIEKLLSEQG